MWHLYKQPVQKSLKNNHPYKKRHNHRRKLRIHRFPFRLSKVREKLCIRPEKLCIRRTFFYLNSLQFLQAILGDPDLSKVPHDVIIYGQDCGRVGLPNWPMLTHQEVIDCIDSLPPECTEDYNRVQFSHIY